MSCPPAGPRVVVDREGAGRWEEVGAVAAAVVVAPDRHWCSCRWVARWVGAVVFEEELECAVWAVGDERAGSAGVAGRRGGRRGADAGAGAHARGAGEDGGA